MKKKSSWFSNFHILSNVTTKSMQRNGASVISSAVKIVFTVLTVHACIERE